MKKIKIIGALVVLVVVILLVKSFGGSGQQVSQFDTVDTVGSFYGDWLEAVKEPLSADPSAETLAKSPILSKVLREKIAEARANSETNLDPVLCQAEAPADISIRKVYENEGEAAQILVTEKGNPTSTQALITLEWYKDGWFIKDIECSLGEVAPEREFSFEQTGFLLKDSIPSPFDSKNWHIIFEDNGVAGNVVPIFFDSKSECTALDGKIATCDPSKFSETSQVSVKGQMTERGATIQKLEFVK